MATPKKSGQALDAVKAPGSPSASGRPLVVTNRPMMTADPMLNASTTEGGAKTVETASTAAPAPSEKVVTHEIRGIAPIDSDAIKDDIDASPEASDTPPHAEVSTDDDTIPGEDNREKNAIPGETAGSGTLPIAATPDTDAASEVSTQAGPQGFAAASQQAVASDRELELEQLVQKGTYAVPIGQLKKRRRKIVWSLVLFILIVALACNILLDLELVSIESVPHTNFL